jgi:hypothetical protein
MAEIDIYISIEESNNFVEWLFDNKYTLIPDTCQIRKKDIGEKINNFKEFQKQNDNWGYMNLQYGKYFIEHQSFTKLPIVIKNVFREKENQQTYWIQQREGGPFIDYNIPRIIKKENNRKILIPADLSYYPTYFNQKENRNEKASDVLRKSYNDMSKYLRKNSKKIKLEVRTIYISPGAIELYNQGIKLSSYFDGYSDKEVKKILGL